jgi:phage tail P2-like protein
MVASMNDFLPPNATKLERDVSETFTSISNIPNPISTIYNVDTCPEHLLPWLAWALSVDFWDSSFSTAQKRQSIKKSFEIHLKKGTVASLEYALKILNITFDITEWFENGGDPYTFILNVYADSSFENNGVIITDVIAEKVVQIVQQTKPVRCHGQINVGARLNSDMPMASNANILPYTHLTAECEASRDFDGAIALLNNMNILTYCHFSMEA